MHEPMDKSGQFLPKNGAGRYQTIQWLMFQMGGIGPMFGQLGYFHRFAGKDYEDKFYAAGELMGIADFPHVTRAGGRRNFLRVPRS